jgi:hypothetical protein
MAEIHIERKGGSRAWIWIVAAVLLVIIVVAALHMTGYIDLTRIGVDVAVRDHSLALLLPAALIPEA